jgi:hypothetical protein
VLQAPPSEQAGGRNIVKPLLHVIRSHLFDPYGTYR